LTSTLAAQHDQVADVVQNFGTIMDSISQRTEATMQFARGARHTFETIASRDQALRDTLHELPYIIKTNTDVVAQLETGNTIGPTLEHLASTLRKLKPTLDLLGPASVKGLSVLRELGAASPSLRDVLVDLEDLEPSSVKALPQVHSALCQANPMARFLEPYDRDLAAFFSNFGATTDAYLPGSRRGHMLFTSAHIDPPHLFRGVTAGAPDQALTALYNFGIFSPVADAGFGYHALPGPGKIGDPELGKGMAGPIDWGKEHEYPHVVADCKK
jgi:ABC-type transporter Mla subunit MlaD